jgi:hypothetical protein
MPEAIERHVSTINEALKTVRSFRQKAHLNRRSPPIVEYCPAAIASADCADRLPEEGMEKVDV